MKKTLKYFILFFLFLSACSFNKDQSFIRQSNEQSGIRPLSPAEGLEDFRELVSLVRSFYAPLEYKQELYKFNLNELVRKTELKIKASKNDDEILGHMMSFIAQFRDGHFKISAPFTSTGLLSYRIPILIGPAEGQMVILSHRLSASFSKGVQPGDVVVSVDGLSYQQLLKKITTYINLGNPTSNEHLIVNVFNRPAYMTELTPTDSNSTIVIKKSDGSLVTLIIPWTTLSDKNILAIPIDTALSNSFHKESMPLSKPLNLSIYQNELNFKLSNNSSNFVGDTNPFYYNDNTQNQYQAENVELSEAAKTQIKIAFPNYNDPDEVFAVKYKFNDKNILLLRNHTYVANPQEQDNLLLYYENLLKENEATTDVLIYDQSNNPGGSSCQEIYRLFIDKTKDKVFYRFNADRKNLELLYAILKNSDLMDYDMISKVMIQSQWSQAENSYDNHENLTPPLSEDLATVEITPRAYHWKKPMLVVSNELSMSCADIFAALIKNNKTAKIFGMRTAGLGGNVSSVGALKNSNFQVNMTRSLFQYGLAYDAKFPYAGIIENKGIEPDYVRPVLIKDIQNGYIDYFKDLSTKAVEQIQTPTALSAPTL